MDRNKVVLVDQKDNTLGTMDKLDAHQQGVLHRAFSIFIFNNKNELLLQQRAEEKYHGGGLWTNTCCSHPQLDEDLKNSASERLQFEMGLDTVLQYSYSFIYQAKVENDLIEHELDHVFIGHTDMEPKINTEEVMAYKYISIPTVLEDLQINPERYTAWFKIAMPQVAKKLAL